MNKKAILKHPINFFIIVFIVGVIVGIILTALVIKGIIEAPRYVLNFLK